jgi:uncharacterized membrane protein YfhO
VQVAYDTPWRAWSGNTPLPIQKAPLGFMRIDAPPGEHDLRLVFTTPLENIVGRVLTVIALIVAAWLATTGLRAREDAL